MTSHKSKPVTLQHAGRAPKDRQHPFHWSKVKKNFAVVLYTIDELHRSTKNKPTNQLTTQPTNQPTNQKKNKISPSKISARKASLVEESIPFINPCRCTRFTRVCFPINKAGIPRTFVFKDTDYTAHSVLPFLDKTKYHGGVSQAAKSS